MTEKYLDSVSASHRIDVASTGRLRAFLHLCQTLFVLSADADRKADSRYSLLVFIIDFTIILALQDELFAYLPRKSTENGVPVYSVTPTPLGGLAVYDMKSPPRPELGHGVEATDPSQNRNEILSPVGLLSKL